MKDSTSAALMMPANHQEAGWLSEVRHTTNMNIVHERTGKIQIIHHFEPVSQKRTTSAL